MHDFKINGFDTSRWSMFFADGTYQELVKAPTKKVSPLNFNWSDEHGEQVDRSYNFYESKMMSLPVVMHNSTELELLLKYNQFVNEVLVAGSDIMLSVSFLNRVFKLRYTSVTNVKWDNDLVTFNVELVDDYPHLITPIV